LRELARIANQEGDSQRFLVEQALVTEAVFAEEVSVIAGVDDYRILAKAQFIEGIKDTTEIFIHSLNVPQEIEVDVVGSQTGVWFARFRGLPVDGRNPEVRGGATGFPLVEMAEAGREIFSTAPAVRAFEADYYGEGRGMVFLNPFDSEVGADVIDPAGARGLDSVDHERAVGVFPWPMKLA
jgi:hypothetical protein